MTTFDELAASRRHWIEDVLKPWCVSANRKDLLRAAMDWQDIAGRVDEEATLWTWAWSRFPALVHEGLSGVNETRAVTLTLKSGEIVTGFPEARESKNGQLVLLSEDPSQGAFGPYSIDEIENIEAPEA